MELDLRGESKGDESEWFRNLPDHAREEMRAHWEDAAAQADERRLRRRKTTKRYLIEGVALYTVMFWMFYIFTWSGLLLSIAVGAAVGSAAAALRAKTYVYAVLGAAGHCALMTVHFVAFSIVPLILTVAACVILGAVHALNCADFTEC